MTLKELRAYLRRWDRFGFEVGRDGTLIWGSLTKTTNRGWLHQVMPAHPRDKLNRFLAENVPLSAFRHPLLWHEMNGIKLFTRSFCLYGPSIYSEAPQIWQAFDVMSVNVGQQELHARFDGVIFGGAEFGRRSVFFLESRSGEVVSVDRDTSEETFRWSDFDTFLSSTLKALAEDWLDEECRISGLRFL